MAGDYEITTGQKRQSHWGVRMKEKKGNKTIFLVLCPLSLLLPTTKDTKNEEQARERERCKDGSGRGSKKAAGESI